MNPFDSHWLVYSVMYLGLFLHLHFDIIHLNAVFYKAELFELVVPVVQYSVARLCQKYQQGTM